MEALNVLGWAAWLILSIALVFEFVGYRGITTMFPEGKRNWHFPAQVISMVFFTLAVLHNPWGTF